MIMQAAGMALQALQGANKSRDDEKKDALDLWMEMQKQKRDQESEARQYQQRDKENAMGYQYKNQGLASAGLNNLFALNDDAAKQARIRSFKNSLFL